jgi:hypothetical protein
MEILLNQIDEFRIQIIYHNNLTIKLVSVAGVKKGKKVLDNNQEAIQLEWVIF